jgi:hypothetical protein
MIEWCKSVREFGDESFRVYRVVLQKYRAEFSVAVLTRRNSNLHLFSRAALHHTNSFESV